MLGYFNEEPVLKANAFQTRDESFPKTMILSWQPGFENELKRKFSLKEYKKKLCAGGTIVTIYLFKSPKNGAELAFCLIPAGSPVAAMAMEELSVIGAENFVFIGSAGSLREENGDSLILPVKAFRDEGTSCHYLESADEFVSVGSADFTESFLKEEHVPYVKGCTWTTDAIYRETKSAINEAKKRGCICVEMECASIMAVAEARGFNAYQLLFTADKLVSKEWDAGRMINMEENAYSVYLEIIIRLAEKADAKSEKNN